MIKIGLCDDNLKLLENISKLMESSIINNDFDAEVSVFTDNQQIIYEQIKNKKLDVLFLDINFQNSGKNGIEFAKDLRKLNKDFYLVFLTGHFEYSLVSFKCKTFDYILKPFSTNTLDDIIVRLKDDLTKTKTTCFIKANKDFTIRTNDILFIERAYNKTRIHTENNVYISSESLSSLSEQLPDSFSRYHRGYIINYDAIDSIDRQNKKIQFTLEKSCPLKIVSTAKKLDVELNSYA